MNQMTVVYALEQLPTKVSKSIFLAGPTPRSADVPSWRPEALRILRDLGYDGHVLVPESRSWADDYTNQIEWELAALSMADVIVFWVPREMKTMPALTTNVEYGSWVDSGKVILGYPESATSVRYLQHLADKFKCPTATTLSSTLTQAVDMFGKGSPRVEGECTVPLLIWQNPVFQEWYAAQLRAGNKLLDSKVLWTFRVGPTRKLVLFWALQVWVWIRDEDRVKSNEVVLARPDMTACLLYHKDQVVLIREFRSPVRNDKGFVYELVGGSSLKKGQSPLEIVRHEVEEETGLKLEADRFFQIETRQSAATLSAHVTHLFAVELTEDEIGQFDSSVAHGVVDDTEQTYVEVRRLKDILSEQLVDWSNLGMILSVLGR
jgi:8-oxo-dGTP pyrophosphatase MutT (NUDIX family)